MGNDILKAVRRCAAVKITLPTPIRRLIFIGRSAVVLPITAVIVILLSVFGRLFFMLLIVIRLPITVIVVIIGHFILLPLLRLKFG